MTGRGTGAPAQAPPDHPAEPDELGEVTAPSWRYVVRRTLREFSRDECLDQAAALTYYAVLSVFPAAIALLSLVGLVGRGPDTVDTLVGILRDVGAGRAADVVEPTLLELSRTPGVGLAFLAGLATALWTASGYVGSFARAMNRIYEVREGRPIWMLRPAMLLVTLVLVVLAALVSLGLVVSGPMATAVGTALGVGDTPVLVWNVLKWPVLLGIVMLMVALLYWATPNVRPPRFRWVSVGAGVAILSWVLASAAFGVYLANVAAYDRTYGSLAGAVVFLLWLWITNLALLFGAELDAELERGRQLQAGLPAEEDLQLPPRDTRTLVKAQAKEREDVDRGRRLRLSRGRRG